MERSLVDLSLMNDDEESSSEGEEEEREEEQGSSSVDLGALISKASLEGEEARAVLIEHQRIAAEAHPFETFSEERLMPHFVVFGPKERENMHWELVDNKPSFKHSNQIVMDFMSETSHALPVFDIVSLVIPADIFMPGQKTIGDIQQGSEAGYTFSTALYLLCAAMSDTKVGTPSMRLVHGIPFPRYTDQVITFSRPHRKVTLLMERLVRDNAGVGEAEDVTEAFSSASVAAKFVLNREDNMAGVRFMWLVHDPSFDPDEAIRCALHTNAKRMGGVPKTGHASVSDEFMNRLFDTASMSGEQRVALEKQIEKASNRVRKEEADNEKHADIASRSRAHGADPLANARNITNMLALNNCVFAPYLGEENAKQGSRLADVFLSVDVHISGAALPTQEAYDLTTFRRAFALNNPVVLDRMRMMGVCALQCDEEGMSFDIAPKNDETLAAFDRHGLSVFRPSIAECVSMGDMAQCDPEYISKAPPPWNTVTAVEAKIACYERVVEHKERARLAKKNSKRRARLNERDLTVLQTHRAINDMLDATHSTYDHWDEADESLTDVERAALEEFRQNFRNPVDEKKRYVSLGASSNLVGHNPHASQLAESLGNEGEVTLRVMSPLEAPRALAISLRARISHVAPHLTREAYDDLMSSFRELGKRNLEAVLVRDTRHTVVFNALADRYHKAHSEGRSVCYAKVHSPNLELSNSFFAQDYVNLHTLGVTNEIGATRDFCVTVYRSSSNRDTEESTGIGNGTLKHTIWLGQHGIGKSYNKGQVQKKVFVEGTIVDQGTGSRRANTDIRPDGDGANIFDEVPAPLMGGASSSSGRTDPEFAAQESEWKQLLSEGKLTHNICSLVEGAPGMSHEEKALFSRKRLTLERRDRKTVAVNANALGDNKALLDRFSVHLFKPPKGGATSASDGMVSQQIPSFEQGARGGLGKSTASEAQLSEELKDRQMLNTLYYAAIDTGYVDPPNITMWNIWNVIQRNLKHEFPSLESSHRKLSSIPQAVAIQEAILYGIMMYQNTFVSGGFKVDIENAEVRARPFDLTHLQYIARYAYLTEATAITTMIRHTLVDLIPTDMHEALVLLAKAFCGYTMAEIETEAPSPAQRTKMTYLNIQNSDTGTHEVDYEIVTGPARWHDIMRVLCETGYNADTAQRVIRELSALTVRRNHTSGYNSTPDGMVQALEYVPSKVKKAGFKHEEDTGHGQIRISLTALYKCAPNHLIKTILRTIKARGFRTHSHLSTEDNPVRRVLLTGVSNEVEQYVIGTTECDIDGSAPLHVLDYRDVESRSRMQEMLLAPESGFCVTERSQQLCQRKKDRQYVKLHENGMYHYPELEKNITPAQRAEFDMLDRETRDALAYNFYVHNLDYEMAYAHTPLMMTRRNNQLQEILFKQRREELRNFVYPDNVIMSNAGEQTQRGVRRRADQREANRAQERRIWNDKRSAERVSAVDRLRYIARTGEEEAVVVPAGADATGQGNRISDLTVDMNHYAEKISVSARRNQTAASLTSGMFGFE